MKFLKIFSFLMFGSVAQAGDFYEKNGFAIDGFDPVTFFETSGPKRGLESIKMTYRGSTFLFSSEEHKVKFTANPEKFSPQYDGFCAFGVAGGYKAKSEAAAFTVVEDKLYLNYDASVQKQWLEKQADFISKADNNWATVKSTKKVFN